MPAIYRFLTVLAAGVIFFASAGAAQTTASNGFRPPADSEIRLLRKDLRSEKKQLIAGNLELTDEQAQRFWPVYDWYAAELATINDAKVALIQHYVQHYGTITDEQADRYVKKRASIDEDVLRLRQKYVPRFRAILPGKATALFFQLELRIGLLIDMQIASELPLIQQ